MRQWRLEVGQGDRALACHRANLPEQKPERKIPRTARNNEINHPFTHMIAITITPEAYEAILLGTAEALSPTADQGLARLQVVDPLGHMRGTGETLQRCNLTTG